jgi:hypothetical protein
MDERGKHPTPGQDRVCDGRHLMPNDDALYPELLQSERTLLCFMGVHDNDPLIGGQFVVPLRIR